MDELLRSNTNEYGVASNMNTSFYIRQDRWSRVTSNSWRQQTTRSGFPKYFHIREIRPIEPPSSLFNIGILDSL